MYCGIDPGLKGGIALIKDKEIICYTKMLPDYEFIKYVQELIKQHKNITFVIEKVSAMPGQGVSSMFKFGYNTGYLYGVLHTLQQRVIEITPRVWKQYFKIPGKKRGQESKDLTALAVRQFYPEMIDIKFHDGVYDAILIAKYQIEKDKK